MTYEERIISILEAMDLSAERYADAIGALRTESDSFYKKKNRTEDPSRLMLHTVRLHCNAYVLEFRYTSRAAFNTVQSILECLVYPDKGEDAIAIPLAMLLDYCDVGTLAPLAIPMIADAEGMEEAFSALVSVLEAHRATLERVASTPEERARVTDAFLSEIIRLLKLTPDPAAEAYGVRPYLGDALYAFLTVRFVSVPFLSLLRGDRDRACKQLRRIKEPLGVEVRLLHLLESAEADSLPHLPLARDMISDAFTAGGTQKTSGKEFFSLLLAWLLLTVLFTPLYAGLYYLLRFFAAGDAVYLLTPSSSVIYGILFAFLTAIAASYFLRLPILRLLYRRDYGRRLALDHLQNGKSGDRVIKVLLHLIVIAALVLTVLLSKWNVSFSEHSFTDNSDFFSLTGEYHAYSDVEVCYYRPDRVNDLGETIPYPSWVLRLKDGREIDFYELGEIEEYDPALLDLLRSKGIPIDASKK